MKNHFLLSFFFLILYAGNNCFAQCNVAIGGTTCSRGNLTASFTNHPSSLEWKLNGSTVKTEYPKWSSYAVVGPDYSTNTGGVYADSAGNIYVTEVTNHRVTKFAPDSSTGVVVAGGHGEGSAANQLAYPQDVFVDKNGAVYVADGFNHRIQKWNPGDTVGTTVAGGSYGSGPQYLFAPTSVFVDASGNIYINDAGNTRIQKWAPGATSGVTVAGGNGPGSAANQLNYNSYGIFVDGAGNIYIADSYNNRIQKWAPGASSGVTVAGDDGIHPNTLHSPTDVWVDAAGNMIITDGYTSRLVYWPIGTFGADYAIATGSYPNGLYAPYALWATQAGDIYVSSQGTNRVLKYSYISIADTFIASTNGNYSVVNNSFGNCIASSGTRLVTASPNADLNSQFICYGASASLSASGITALTWYPGNLAGSTQTVSPPVTTTYTVTDLNNCSATSRVDVDPAVNPVVGGSICLGNGVVLGTYSAPPLSWEWQVNNHTIKTGLSTWNKNGIVVAGGRGGSGADQLSNPAGIYVDKKMNVYVADPGNARVQKWAPGATSGVTVAGGNGNGYNANQLANCNDVCVDDAGNVYVSDYQNCRVQKWAPGATEGVTVAGGYGFGSAPNQLAYANAVFVDDSLNLYVTDLFNHRVQKWAPGATSGVTVAGGNGPGGNADQLNFPGGIYVDHSGNVYVADYNNARIQKWAPGATSGVTVAGGSLFTLSYSKDLVVDRSGNMYIMDNGAQMKFWPAGASQGTTVVNYLSGFNYPQSIAIDSTGAIYISDAGLNNVRKFTVNSASNFFRADSTGSYKLFTTSFNGCGYSSPASNVYNSPGITAGKPVSICSGAGTTLSAFGTSGYVWNPGNLSGATQSFTPSTNTTYTVTDANNCSTSVTVYTNTSPTVSISGNECTNSTLTAAHSSIPARLEWSRNGTLMHTEYPTWFDNAVTVAGGNGGGNGANQTYSPFGIAVDPLGNVYVSEANAGRVTKWAPGATQGVKVAGGGYGSNPDALSRPWGIFLDGLGNLYICDADNHRVQRWKLGDSLGVTVAGGYGAGSAPNQLNYPSAVYVDNAGNVYVDDYNNARIQKWAPGATSGVTVAGGNGSGNADTQINGSYGLYVDPNGNVFVGDLIAQRIQKWAPGATSGVTILGGSGNAPGAGEIGPINGLFTDPAGTIYCLEGNSSGSRILRIKDGETSYATIHANHGYGNGANQIPGALNGAFDPQGNIYVTDFFNNRVQMFSLSGITDTYMPFAAGSYTATIRAFGGCDVTSTSLDVQQSPLMDESSTTLICDHENATLTVTGSGNYTWSPGNLSGTSISVSPSTTTVYTITDNGSNCSSTYTLKVNPLSNAVITGPNCLGNGTLNVTWGATPLKSEYKLNGNTIQTYYPSWTTSATAIAGNNGAGDNLNQLRYPRAICLDAAGNVYAAEEGGNRVTKWAPGATSGVIVAGGNGYGGGASQFRSPEGVAVDKAGNVYVADNGNNRVTKWAPGATYGETVAGGNGQGSDLNQIYAPYGLFIDDDGNLYVCESGNHRVSKWAPGATSGVVVAGGNSYGNAANQLWNPIAVFVDKTGNVYVADQSNQRIQKWAPGATEGVTVAGGNGEGFGNNQLYYPAGIFVDGLGTMYINSGSYIVKWEPGGTTWTYLMGFCCNGPNAIWGGYDVQLDQQGNIVTADYVNCRVQKFNVNPPSSFTPTVPGDYSIVNTSFDGCVSTTTTFTVHPYPSAIPTGNLYFCQGSSTTLDAGTHDSHVWSTGDTTQTKAIDTEGTYALTVSDFGCSKTDSFFVAQQTPVINPSASVPSVCNGQSSQLNAGLVSGGNTYLTKTYYITANNLNSFYISCSNGVRYYYNPQFSWTDSGMGTVVSVQLDFTVGYNGGSGSGQYTAMLNGVSDPSGVFNQTPNDQSCGIANPANRRTLHLNPANYHAGSGNSIYFSTGYYWGLVPDVSWNNQYARIIVTYKVPSISYSWMPGGMTTVNPTVTPAATTTYTVTATSLGCSSSSTVTVTLTNTQGNPSVFGDHVWNVYAWNAGNAYDNGQSWNTNYAGFYVDSAMNYDSQSKWNPNGSPSLAVGYAGCVVNNDNMSWSAKRIGFPCGYYQLNVPSHDDMAQLFVNGSKVWEHNGCCDSHTNVWTGYLTDTSRVEFRVTEGGGGAVGKLNFVPGTLNLTGNGPGTICPGYTETITSGLPGTYQWNTGATTATINVNTAATYSVTVTLPEGCTVSSAPYNLSIDTLPISQIYSYSGLSFCPAYGYVDLNIDYNSRYSSVLWSDGEPYYSAYVSVADTYSVVVSDALGCTASASAIVTSNGDQTVFGTNVWNVYNYAEGDDQDYGYSWLSQDYIGYYIDSSLNFNSADKWDIDSDPSSAPGYVGCLPFYGPDYFSWSAKRQGFPCGIYQIDVPANDDEAQLFVGGVKVWDSNSGMPRTNVWRGPLNSDSKIEFRVTEGYGECYGSLNFTLLDTTYNFIDVSGHAVVCSGQSYTLTSTITGTSYEWSNGASTNPTAVSSTGSFDVEVTDAQGCSLTSEPASITILPDAAPVAHISASDTTSCDWNAVTLSSDSTAGNTWSTGATSQSVNVIGGTHFLSVTNQVGCTDTAYMTIHSGFTPPQPVASNNGSVCEGSAVNLSAQGLAPGGQVLSMSGSSYSRVPQNIPESNFTIEMWVKTTAANTGIFSATDGYFFSSRDRDLYVVNGQLWARVWSGSGWNTGFTINDGKWHHIALVVQTGVGQKVYVDGIPGANSNSYDHSNFTWQTSLMIGYTEEAGYDNRYFNGELDNIRIWSEPRTQIDIRNNMMLETPLATTNLVYAASFNGTLDATVGNNSDGSADISYSAADHYTYTWSGAGAPAASILETQTTTALSGSGLYSVTASLGACGSSAGASTNVVVNPATHYYADADSDGYGSSSATVLLACSDPGPKYVTNNSDCNDTNANVYPGATEVCNSLDDDCNGQIDENGFTASITAGGPLSFCQGSSVTLSALPSGIGYSYQWYNESGVISGATNNTYVATATGDYHAVVIQSACSSISNTISVSVSAAPVAAITPSGAVHFCAHTQVILSANTGAGLSHQWYRNNAVIPGATNPTFSAGGSQGGVFKVLVTNAGSCTKFSNTATLTRLLTPNAAITVVNPSNNPDLCVNGQVQLRANGGSGLAYQWYQGNTAIAGATSRDYTTGITGSFKVVVTNLSSGCTKPSANVHVIRTCKEDQMESDAVDEVQLSIYPNPAKNLTTIESFIPQESETILRILDMFGREVYISREGNISGKITKELNVANWIQGTYIVQLITGGEIHSSRLVIQQ